MVKYNHRNENFAVGTTALSLLDLSKERSVEIIAIKNTSLAGQVISMSVGIGQTAVSGSGIVLDPKESWGESIEGTFAPTHEPVSVISDGAGATVSIYTRIRVD